MRAHHRRIVGAAASFLLVVGALAAPSATFANTIVHQADLTGVAEVPGPGDPDASGFAEINVDPANGIICWTIIVEGMDPATAAHVHVGAEGIAGPVVVALGTPDADGFTSDCSSGHDPGDLQSIADDPTGHYVNVHNAAFPAGAVRGQLSEAIELSNVVVAVYACPEGIDGPDDVTTDEVYETCSPVALPGDFGPIPADHEWDNDPIEMALALELSDPAGTLTIDDAELFGGGTCNSTTLLCHAARQYEFDPTVAGPTAVQQASFPNGYVFGWAELSSVGFGTPPSLISNDAAGVTFDTTGIDDGAFVLLVNVVAATPSPPPSGTQAPLVTPPPTSTIDEGSTPSSITPAFAVIVMFGLAAVAIGYRRRLTR